MVSDPKKWQELLNDLTTIGLPVRLCLCTESIPTCGSVWLHPNRLLDFSAVVIKKGNPHAGHTSLSFAEMRKWCLVLAALRLATPKIIMCATRIAVRWYFLYNYLQVSNVSILGFVKKTCFWMLQQLALHQVLILFAVVLCGEIWGVAGTLTMRKSLPGGRWFQNVKWDGYNYTRLWIGAHICCNKHGVLWPTHMKHYEQLGSRRWCFVFLWEGNRPQKWVLFLFISGFMNKRLKPQRPSNQQTMKSQSKESHAWLSHNLMMNNTKDINQNAP
jgi:hypothetical protein